MRKLFIIFLISLLPLTASCRMVSDRGDAVVVQPVAGSAFNTLFPQDQGDYNVLFTQEKEGFAQARLNLNGVEVATLSISDTANMPDALDKFRQSTMQIAGYPAAAVGELGTAILVADRFQVQVRSKDSTFSATDRESWLTQFDLSSLAALP